MNRKILLRYSDKEIEDALKHDKEEVFEYLFKTFFPPLVNYAIRFLNDRELAKEVVQECFITIWDRRKSLKITTSVTSYLFTATRNRCINYLKSKYHQHTEPIELGESMTVSDIKVDDMLHENDLAKILQQSIAGLNEKTRIFFNLSRENELSYKEISEKMSVSIKTVEFHISAALKQIREDLQKYWHLPVIVIAFSIYKILFINTL